jgi:translation initiation factor 3 subunit K
MALAEAQSIVQSLHRYSPESAAALEAAVEEQVEQVTYDLDVNMALLKIYQFNPELYNKDVVVNILIKCIMALPQPDFTLCVSMLTEDQVRSILSDYRMVQQSRP